MWETCYLIDGLFCVFLLDSIAAAAVVGQDCRVGGAELTCAVLQAAIVHQNFCLVVCHMAAVLIFIPQRFLLC